MLIDRHHLQVAAVGTATPTCTRSTPWRRAATSLCSWTARAAAHATRYELA